MSNKQTFKVRVSNTRDGDVPSSLLTTSSTSFLVIVIVVVASLTIVALICIAVAIRCRREAKVIYNVSNYGCKQIPYGVHKKMQIHVNMSSPTRSLQDYSNAWV